MVGRVKRPVMTMRAIAIAALAAGMLATLGACPKRESTDTGTGARADASTDASANATTKATSTADGKKLVGGACLSCHTEHMLAQQRLTEAQWQKVVTKMVGWGANLEPAEVGPLVSYLSASYGPDAGTYTPAVLPAAGAATEVEPVADPFPPGDAARGKPLYVDKCSGCHGPDARGHIGVNLVDRPFLYRAAELAMTVRRGRGKMLPIPIADNELADILAHLRSLKHAPPPPAP